MFANAFQNGHYFQIWDSKSSNDKNDAYKQLCRVIPASNKKYYDKQYKSYLLPLQQQNSKIFLPANDQKELSLHQRYLVLHIFIPVGSPWSMQLGITDINGIRRRIYLTTMQGKNQGKYFSYRYTIDVIERGVWMFLSINLNSFIDAFKGQTYRSLDHLVIGNSCILRRIFTMKQWQHWQIPKAFWLSSQIPQSFHLIQYRELILPKINLHKSLNKSQTSPQRQGKQTIKHSKSNLVKSQIPYKIMNQSKIVQESLIKSNIQPLIQKKKIANLKLSVAKSNRINQKSLKQEINLQKSTNIFKNKQILEQIIKGDQNNQRALKIKQKIQKITYKKSPQKSPKIQKSFQQDEAFHSNQQIDTQSNLQQKLQNFKLPYKLAKPDIQFQKWQTNIENDIQNQVREQKKQNKLRVKTKQSKTVLGKENSIKKMQQSQNKIQLQLIYDEMVGCFYHPQTQTYYDIKE